MSGREDMIASMESLLGTTGRPNNVTRWYAARNGSYFATAPWCDETISWAAYDSGNYREVCFGTDFAYTVYHAQRYEKASQWHFNTSDIRRGDIIFFDWNHSNSVTAIDHVGIVTDVKGGDIYTIEGNTSNACLRRVRREPDIVGYGRPKYKDDVPEPEPKKDELPVASCKLVKAAGLAKGGVASIGGKSSKKHTLLCQKALKKTVGLDYSSGPGYYGPRTKAAMKEFQESQWPGGSMNDGIVGPETLKRLGSKSKLLKAGA